MIEYLILIDSQSNNSFLSVIYEIQKSKLDYLYKDQPSDVSTVH